MNTTKEKNTQTYPDILWLSWADWDRYASTISNSGRLRESNDDIEGFTNQKKGYLFGEWRSIINDGDSPIVWVCWKIGNFYASLFLQIWNFPSACLLKNARAQNKIGSSMLAAPSTFKTQLSSHCWLTSQLNLKTWSQHTAESKLASLHNFSGIESRKPVFHPAWSSHKPPSWLFQPVPTRKKYASGKNSDPRLGWTTRRSNHWPSFIGDTSMHVSVQLQHFVAQSRLIVGSKCYDYNMCVCIGVHDHLDLKVPVVKPPCSTLHPFPTLTPSSPLVAPPPDVVPLLALPATVVELPSAATVWVPWRYSSRRLPCLEKPNRFTMIDIPSALYLGISWIFVMFKIHPGG